MKLWTPANGVLTALRPFRIPGTLALVAALTGASACGAEEDASKTPTQSADSGKADKAPPCCDPDADGGGPEGSHCCADGGWRADLGNNDAGVCDPVGGLGMVCEEAPETAGGTGDPVACCDPDDEGVGGPEGSHCCADGTWQEDLGSNDPGVCDPLGGLGLVCGGETDGGGGTGGTESTGGSGWTEGSSGTGDPAACCDPDDAGPGSPEGSHCCADGTWQEDLGSNDASLCDPFGGLGEICEA